MITATGTLQPDTKGDPAVGTCSAALPKIVLDARAEFDFPAFNYSFTAPITAVTTDARTHEVTIKAQAEEAVTLVCTMRAHLNGAQGTDSGLQVGVELNAPQPRAAFVATTLLALLRSSRATHLRFPLFQSEYQAAFPAPLKSITETLRDRQTAFRAMILERAFERPFEFQPNLSHAEWAKLTFAHHAVVERSVVWSFSEEALSCCADEETRAMLTASCVARPLRLTLARLECEALGQCLTLGRAVVSFENALLLNCEEIERELQRLDGHEFIVRLRALDGLAKYEFIDAPRLPSAAWDKRITELIELGERLDEVNIQAYHELVAGCLPYLDEELPPPFDEEFVLLPEPEGVV